MRGTVYRVASLIQIAADKLNASVHDHLRSVYFVGLEDSRIFVLPLAEFGRRVRIGPPQTIPVVDVFGKRDDLCAPDRLSLFKTSEQLVGWWATRAPLGREELDQNGGWRPVWQGAIR